MNALSTLIQNHERVSDLFELLQGCDDSQRRRDLFQQIKKDLGVHAALEEHILYPHLERFDELTELVDESYDELQEMREILVEIDQIEIEAADIDPLEITALRDELDGAIEELIDVVSYHLEEEEAKLFPRILRLMSIPELDRLESALLSERKLERNSSEGEVA